jgi:isoquinoline 1-oxidoreductase beta subunit
MSIFEKQIQRRQVLKTFLVAGPTLAIGARLGLDDLDPSKAGAAIRRTPDLYEHQDFSDIFVQTATPFYYDLVVDIKPNNRVYFEIPRMDIGQGPLTSITMMMADNLDAPFENFDSVLSKAEPKRADGQLTGGSSNVRGLWDPVRIIAAQIRAHLTTAASHRWGISPNTLRTSDGYVIAPDGRKLSYGELTAEAAKLSPKDIPKGLATLKKPSDYKIIGTPRFRTNAKDIVTGKAPYAMDFPVEGCVLTTYIAPKTLGATVKSIDDSEAKKIPGFIGTTEIPGLPSELIPGGVAVMAETFGVARKAKNLVKVTWNAGPMDNMSDADIDQMLEKIIDPPVVPDTGEGMIDATFRWPYINQAPMETNTAVARVTKDKAEIWGGFQIPNAAVRNIAVALGMKEEQVVIHVIPRGGAFGRALFHDAGFQAAQISQRVGKPIKLMWMREEDIKYGRTRPVSIHKVRATIKGGDVASFEHHMACAEMDLRHGLGDVITHNLTRYDNDGVGKYFFEQSASGHIPYNVGFRLSTLEQTLLAVPTSPWRVVYSGQVCSINDIVMSELARMMGKDEYEFLRAHLQSEKHQAVLDKAAHEGQWGKKLPAGVAQGLGFHDEYHGLCAMLMEVDVRGAFPRVRSCTIACDPGFLVNPMGAEGELQGCAHDGIGTVFRAAEHVEKGVIKESNWYDYKWTRMFDSPPEYNIHFLPNNQAEPGGIGELGVPAAAAAAANAWARATGKQVRKFPVTEYGA